jgi:uncharacterized protein (DUF58 family)
VEPGLLPRVLLVGAAGLCLFLGLVFDRPPVLAFAGAVLLLVVLARRTARRRLAHLHASRTLTPSAFEDEEVRVEVALENHGRLSVSLVEVTDSFGAALAERKSFLDASPLRPGRRHRMAYRSACTRLWGVYTVGPLTVSVSDPLGLFSPRLLVPDVRPFDLFPKVQPVGGLEKLGARPSFSPSDPTTAPAGQSAVYLAVRDFRAGDDVRRIHWPATARHDRPMVKEFERDLTPYFTLFLDLERDHRAGTGRVSTLEYVVRTAASLLASAARRGDTVQLFAEGREAAFVPPGCGELHLALALDRLIRLRQDGTVPVLDLARREEAAVPRASTVAILAATLFLDTGRLAEAFGHFQARRIRPVLVAVDMDSFLPVTRRPRPREAARAQAEELRGIARDHGALVAVLDAEHDLPAELARPDWLAVE